MSKIKRITVSNLKAVSAMSADFNGCTAIITGGNNKGKSSFLRGIVDRIRGIKPDAVLKHGESEGYAEVELTTGEKFVWSFENKTKQGEKLVFISERNIKGPVSKDIATVYFPQTFDVDAFLNSAPAKQKATLQKITGIDFSEFDKKYKDAYESRTFFNKQYEIEKAKGEYVDPKLPKDELPTEDIEKELNGIDLHNLKYNQFSEKVEGKKKQVANNDAEIERLALLISDLQEQNEALQTDIENGKDWLNEEKNKVKDNAEQLKVKLKEVKDKNDDIKKNNLARLQDIRIEKSKKDAEAADKEVKSLEAEKLEVIKNASMPEGFGFSEDGITYNGFAFNKESLSSSGIYIGALKLAASTLGEVKSLHFDASFLDKNSLSEIEKWANENDLQLLIERPDFEGGEIEYHLINQETTLAVA